MNFKKYLLAGFLIGMAIFNMQGQNEVDLIQGQWKINFEKTFENISSQDSLKISHFPPEAKDKLKEFYQGRQYDFLQNGKYILRYNNGTIYRSIWRIEKDMVIKLKNTHGLKQSFKIENLTNQEAILQVITDGREQILVDKVYLERI